MLGFLASQFFMIAREIIGKQSPPQKKSPVFLHDVNM
jgi:hypothetical protein